MKTIQLLCAVFLFTSVLTACNQPSLSALPKKQQITLLLEASRAAEKEMGLYSSPGGGYYLSCMGANEGYIDCKLLFQLMQHHIQTTSPHTTLSVAELTDKRLFQAIAVDYQEQFFNAIGG